MARLPRVGQDGTNWGDILNDYLLVTHEQDGKLRPSTVSSKSLATPTSGTDGQVLVKDSTATSGMTWQAASTTMAAEAVPTGTAGGDLSGTYPNPTVPGLATKAANNSVVHLTGNETVTGTKNFTGVLQSGGVVVVKTTDVRLSDQRSPLNTSVTTAKLVDGNVTEAKLADAVKTKLNAVSPISSVNGMVGAVTVTKTTVGLDSVDNTSDINKPLSTAMQTALSTKVDSAALAAVDTRVTSLESFNRVLVLTADQTVPANTPAGTVILRTS